MFSLCKKITLWVNQVLQLCNAAGVYSCASFMPLVSINLKSQKSNEKSRIFLQVMKNLNISTVPYYEQEFNYSDKLICLNQ